MPELPDVVVYLEHIERRVKHERLENVRLASPFVLRSVSPKLSELLGRQVIGLRRLGKRIVVELENELFIVLHLMIAGRLRWKPRGAMIPGRIGLAALDFASGSLLLTEASTKKRASIHFVSGEEQLSTFDRGGLEPLSMTLESFRAVLKRENHTLKRALTDPRLISGVGNAYSDELLHRARLSPMKQTGRLTEDEIEALFHATKTTLAEWIDHLRRETGTSFPENVTAFRKEMAVHGKYKERCPACGTSIQRIVHGDHETNYCPTCQNEGRILRDRSLSLLLKEDWPSTVDELAKLED